MAEKKTPVVDNKNRSTQEKIFKKYADNFVRENGEWLKKQEKKSKSDVDFRNKIIDKILSKTLWAEGKDFKTVTGLSYDKLGDGSQMWVADKISLSYKESSESARQHAAAVKDFRKRLREAPDLATRMKRFVEEYAKKNAGAIRSREELEQEIKEYTEAPATEGPGWKKMFKNYFKKDKMSAEQIADQVEKMQFDVRKTYESEKEKNNGELTRSGRFMKQFSDQLQRYPKDQKQIAELAVVFMDNTTLRQEDLKPLIKQMITAKGWGDNFLEDIMEEVEEQWKRAEAKSAKEKKNRQPTEVIKNLMYNVATRVAGVKIVTDAVLAAGGRGDLYNWYKAKGEVKAETQAIHDVMESENATEDVDEKIKEVQLRIERSQNIAPEKKKEFLEQLKNIAEKNRENEKNANDERKAELRKILETYIHNKYSGMEQAKQLANFGLTISGLWVGRAAMYGAASVVERGKKAAQKYEEQVLEYGKEKSMAQKMLFITRDVSAGAFVETIKQLSAIKDVGVAAAYGVADFTGLRQKLEDEPDRKKFMAATAEFMKGVAPLATAFGIAMPAVQELFSGQDLTAGFDKLMGEIRSGDIGAVKTAFVDNLYGNVERVAHVLPKSGEIVGDAAYKMTHWSAGETNLHALSELHGTAAPAVAGAVGVAAGTRAGAGIPENAPTPTRTDALTTTAGTETPAVSETPKLLPKIDGIQPEKIGLDSDGSGVDAHGPSTAAHKLDAWFKENGVKDWSSKEIKAELERHGYKFIYEKDGSLLEERHPIVFKAGGNSKLVPWVDADDKGHFEIVDEDGKSIRNLNGGAWVRTIHKESGISETTPATRVEGSHKIPLNKPAGVAARSFDTVNNDLTVETDTPRGEQIVVKFNTDISDDAGKMEFKGYSKIILPDSVGERPLDEAISDTYRLAPEALTPATPQSLSEIHQETRTLDDLDTAYQVLAHQGLGNSSEAQTLATQINSLMRGMAVKYDVPAKEMFTDQMMGRYEDGFVPTEAIEATVVPAVANGGSTTPAEITGTAHIENAVRGGGGGGEQVKTFYTGEEWKKLSEPVPSSGGAGAEKTIPSVPVEQKTSVAATISEEASESGLTESQLEGIAEYRNSPFARSLLEIFGNQQSNTVADNLGLGMSANSKIIKMVSEMAATSPEKLQTLFGFDLTKNPTILDAVVVQAGLTPEEQLFIGYYDNPGIENVSLPKGISELLVTSEPGHVLRGSWADLGDKPFTIAVKEYFFGKVADGENQGKLEITRVSDGTKIIPTSIESGQGGYPIVYYIDEFGAERRLNMAGNS